MSQEHPLSQGLRRRKKLRVLISRLPPGAEAWQATFSKEFSSRQASAPMLCGKHNGELSEADAEAKRMSEALREIAARLRSRIVWQPRVVTIDGHLFGRWLCKFYSGCMAMTGQAAHPDFVRYAFKESTGRRLHFLFPDAFHRSWLGSTKAMRLQTYRTEGGDPEAFRVIFEGLTIVVSTVKDGPPIKEIYEDLPFPNGTRVFDRIRAIHVDGLEFVIRLDWSGDPDDAVILSTAGMPTPRRD